MRFFLFRKDPLDLADGDVPNVIRTYIRLDYVRMVVFRRPVRFVFTVPSLTTRETGEKWTFGGIRNI